MFWYILDVRQRGSECDEGSKGRFSKKQRRWDASIKGAGKIDKKSFIFVLFIELILSFSFYLQESQRFLVLEAFKESFLKLDARFTL